MYTILLVDDEYPARQLLKHLIAWEQAGFSIRWEAEDGEQAMKLYREHRPDLVITDIQMPVMDGLEMLSEMRNLHSAQPFIVFSCHESFEYACKVIQLGGLDYLLKDTLTPDLLYTALESAKTHLAGAQPNRVEDEMPPSLAMPEINRLLEQFLDESEPENVMTSELRQVIPSTCGEYFLFLARQERESLSSTAWQLAADALCPHCEAAGFSLRDGIGVALVFPPAEAPEDFKPQLLHRFKALLEHENRSVTLGVSAAGSGLEELPARYREARHALGYSVFLGRGRVHYYDPVMDMAYYVRRKQMQARLANVRQALESANTDALLRELGNLYGQDLTGMQQYHYLLALNQSLWELYVGFLSSAHRPAPDPTRLTRLNSMENPSAMRELMSDLLSALPRAAEEGAYSRRVREIIDYISAHFREEISLESIANVFCVHKTHLARLFKTETGMSLSEFIRRYRVNAAKTLLRDSRFRVNEIAYQVGFNSTQSFYNAFMHCEGVAPKLYREYYC